MNEPKSRLSRRRLFAAAGGVGALATTASVLPARPEPTATIPQAPPPERGGGYRLSEHVQHYYRTTRV